MPLGLFICCCCSARSGIQADRCNRTSCLRGGSNVVSIQPSQSRVSLHTTLCRSRAIRFYPVLAPFLAVVVREMLRAARKRRESWRVLWWERSIPTWRACADKPWPLHTAVWNFLCARVVSRGFWRNWMKLRDSGLVLSCFFHWLQMLWGNRVWNGHNTQCILEQLQ